jgi:hypothetical protein
MKEFRITLAKRDYHSGNDAIEKIHEWMEQFKVPNKTIGTIDRGFLAWNGANDDNLSINIIVHVNSRNIAESCDVQIVSTPKKEDNFMNEIPEWSQIAMQQTRGLSTQ